MKRPVIGISGCLLGEKVRHDGGHTRDKWLTDVLASEVQFKSYCPEVAMGLGVPREPLRLVYNKNGEISLVESDSGFDWTETANDTFKKMFSDLKMSDLSGFILMRKSPTCGAEKVKHYNPDNGRADRYGSGIFASALKREFPDLPVIDCGRLKNPDERELFFRQVYAYQRFNSEVETMHDLVTFHATYKYILMEHSPVKLSALGRIVANSDGMNLENLKRKYRTLFMDTLRTRPNTGRKLNVLQHMTGYFKKHLDKNEKAEIGRLLDEFNQGKTPYLSPVNLLEFLAKKYQAKYLLQQTYFRPYPIQLR